MQRNCINAGNFMSVFNPPPGWPLPRDWAPDSTWKPEPTWPAPPPGWNFRVPKNLKMYPVDLSGEIDLGPVSELHLSRLSDLTNGAADAIAWRLCHLASETNVVPLMTYLRMHDKADSALLEARGRIYGKLIEDARAWVGSLPRGSAEWIAATDTVRRILDSKEMFLKRAQDRVRTVLEASGPSLFTEQSPSERKPDRPQQASREQQASTTTKSSEPKERRVAGYVIIVLLIVLVVGGWVISQVSRPLLAGNASHSIQATGPQDACGQTVKANLPASMQRKEVEYYYSTTTSFTKTGISNWKVEGFARDKAQTQSDLKFSCEVAETQTSGGWEVTLNDLG